MTDKVQKIREKVVEIINSINPFIPDEDGKNSNYEAGKLDVATQILQIIDSMQEEPVSEDLEEAVNVYIGYAPEVDESSSVYGKRLAFKAGAEWQKEKDFQYVKKECERTGSCCDNDIAIEAAKRHPYYYVSEMEAYANIGFKEGAMWQKEQDQSTIELAEDHAMLAGMEKMKEEMMEKAVEVTVHIEAGNYPYIPQIELYDYDKDVPLAKEGDKYKVILIKEE